MQRVVVIGSAGVGKSSLGERLARALEAPFVELDALFWEPNWVEATDEVFTARIVAATAGDRWVVAGNYRRLGEPLLWPRADRIIWLDLPLRVTVLRLARRIWRRWRTREVLWGTNVERFWPQLRLWDPKASLLAFMLTTHAERRRQCLEAMRQPEYRARFVRLTSAREVEAFARAVEAGL